MEDLDLQQAIKLLEEKRPQDALSFLTLKLTSCPSREAFQRLSDDALSKRLFKDDPLDLNRDRLLRCFERVANCSKDMRSPSTLWLQKLVPDLTDREGHYFIQKYHKMFEEKSFMAKRAEHKPDSLVPKGHPSKQPTKPDFVAKCLLKGLSSEQSEIAFSILFPSSSSS